MEINNLSNGLDFLSTNGIVLSTERRVALETALILLKNAEKFQAIYFWGKIQGVSGDYFIAQGHNEDIFSRKSFMRLTLPTALGFSTHVL